MRRPDPDLVRWAVRELLLGTLLGAALGFVFGIVTMEEEHR